MENHESEQWDSISESFFDVLVDIPYSLTTFLNDQNSSHKLFSSSAMKAILNLCGELLKPAALGRIVISALQSGQRYRVLNKEVEEFQRSFE